MTSDCCNRLSIFRVMTFAVHRIDHISRTAAESDPDPDRVIDILSFSSSFGVFFQSFANIATIHNKSYLFCFHKSQCLLTHPFETGNTYVCDC